MRIWSKLVLAAVVSALVACGPSRPATPVETFKTYIKALRAKDTATMTLLLSDATVKMHQQEAKAQGIPLDEIIKRESLLAENQKTVEFRNEKITEDKATLEVKNSYGTWETVPFVREDGVWKIDKQGYAERMRQDIEQQQQRVFDELRSVEPLTPVDPSSTPRMDFITPVPTETPTL